MFIKNQFLLVYRPILIAFYLILTKSVGFTHYEIVVFGYAQTVQCCINRWYLWYRWKVITVEKKPLLLVLPFLATISLQTRLQNSMKGLLKYCKLQVIFKIRKKLWKKY